MFINDHSIDNIQQLFFEFRKYLDLQKKYTLLEIAEKISILVSTLILILVVIILGMMTLFFLSFTLVYILEPLVGGLVASYAIVTGIHLLLIGILFLFRKQLIINPLIKFTAGLFLKKDDKDKN